MIPHLRKVLLLPQVLPQLSPVLHLQRLLVQAAAVRHQVVPHLHQVQPPQVILLQN